MQQCKLYKKNGTYEIFKADFIDVTTVDYNIICIKQIWIEENGSHLRNEELTNRVLDEHVGHEISY